MRKNLLLVLMAVVFSFTTYAQEKRVTGKVTDEAGPLPGVNVLIKGTTIGTSTDANGEFTITVSSDKDVLVFTFIGYTTVEEQVGAKTALNISMTSDAQQLTEVVVVGY